MRFLLAAALVVSSVSFAQTSPGAKEKRQPKSEIRFDTEDEVFGKTQGPDGSMIEGDSRPVFNKMIRIRTDFADKLKASVSELR